MARRGSRVQLRVHDRSIFDSLTAEERKLMAELALGLLARAIEKEDRFNKTLREPQRRFPGKYRLPRSRGKTKR